MKEDIKHDKRVKGLQKFTLGRLAIRDVFDELDGLLDENKKQSLKSFGKVEKTFSAIFNNENRYELSPVVGYYIAVADCYQEIGQDEKSLDIIKECEKWSNQYDVELDFN